MEMPEVTDVLVVESEGQAAEAVVDLLQEAVESDPCARIGTATGGTMIPIYREIASRCAEQRLSLAQVEAFQLDEYHPIDPWQPQSYRSSMKKHLVEVTDLPPTHMHVLNGATHDPAATCARWDHWLLEAPIRLQLCGIGVRCHVAFVEAREKADRALRDSRTMLVDLDESTLRENARFFAPDEAQPTQALTVGIGTLLEVVQHFVLVAFGTKKSAAIANTLLGEVDDRCPASYLREAEGRVTVVLDHPAAATFLARVHQRGAVPGFLNLHALPALRRAVQ